MNRKFYMVLVIVLLLSFGVASLARFPAAMALSLLPESVGLRYAGVSGTIWQGEIKQLAFQNFTTSSVRWQVSAWRLLLLQLQTQVQFGKGGELVGKGRLSYGLFGASVEDVTVNVPAIRVAERLPVPMEFNAGGELELTIEDATHGGDGVCDALTGQLVWFDAFVSLPMGPLPLEMVQMPLSCQQGQLVAQLSQQSDALTSDGNIRVGASDYQVDILVTAGASLSANFANNLPYIGPAENGGYRFTSQGSY